MVHKCILWVTSKMCGCSVVWLSVIIMAILFATGESKTLLTATAQFKISIEPATQTVDLGSPARFTCRSEGNPIETVNWLKDGKDIDHHNAVLSIDSVKKEDRGIYQCFIRNDQESAGADAELKVSEELQFEITRNNQMARLGEPAVLQCKARGEELKYTSWLKDNKSLKDINDSRYTIHEEISPYGTLSELSIKRTELGDNAIFVCIALNDYIIFNLTIQEAPEAVYGLKVLYKSSRSVQLSWVAPYDGNSPITKYWIEYKGYEDTWETDINRVFAPGNTTEMEVFSLHPATTYHLRIITENELGISKPSDTITIITAEEEAPEAVYGLKVLNKSSRSVQLSWVPYDGNSTIRTYRIEYKRYKDSWKRYTNRVSVPDNTTEMEIFSLHPATTYQFRIITENGLEISKTSDAITITTAEETPCSPPSDVRVEALDQHSLKVKWKPPPMQDCNGDIQGYYVAYKLTSTNKPYYEVFEAVDISKETEKEYHSVIKRLKTYTQYSVTVQSFNKMGLGPMSQDVKIYTAEGAPDAPPHDTLCSTLTTQTIRVSWASPPLASANGVIKGYKVIYGPSDSWYDEKSKDTRISSSSEIILDGLKKFTNYSIEVLATTSAGDGVRSTPINCQTKDDVPEAATEVKALVTSQDSVLVSWRSPTQTNGVITHYTVYTQSPDSEPTSNKVLAPQMIYSATDLKRIRYNFWVTASTAVGEGQPSPTVSAGPKTKVPAKIASFDDSFTPTLKEDVKLPCLAVGVPPPSVSWKIKGAPLVTSNRVRQSSDGTLLIAGVTHDDAGNYTCLVENEFGTDSVTHKLTVKAPPVSPAVTLISSDISTLSLRLLPLDITPSDGYTIYYKQKYEDWKTIQVSSQAVTYTLENLNCGSSYQVFVTAHNRFGTGRASDVLNARTQGSKPIIYGAADFMEASSNSVTLHLKQWRDGGCPFSHFVIKIKKKGTSEWNQIFNRVNPLRNFVVLDLEPATWYSLSVTGHNSAGYNDAGYEFGTLNTAGVDLQHQDTKFNNNTNDALINNTHKEPDEADQNFILSLIPHFKQIPEEFKLDAEAEILMVLKKFKSYKRF